MDKRVLMEMKTKLENITEVLYKGKVDEGIARMSEVLPDISLMAAEIKDEGVQQQLITDALTPLLEAMEDRDGTMMADIISYELIPIADNM